MKKFSNWIIQHPVWGVIGGLGTIIALTTGLINFIHPPVKPELIEIRKLLIDTVNNSVNIVYSGRSSGENIMSGLGGIEGWSSSLTKIISYAQGSVGTVMSHDGFTLLADDPRRIFTGIYSDLDKYKDQSFAFKRRKALVQHVCHLILVSLKAVAKIDREDVEVDCKKTDLECRHQRSNFAKNLGVSDANCLVPPLRKT